MIYSLQGELACVEPQLAVIVCAGVGFSCRITLNTMRQLPPVGNTVMLYTSMNVREDAVELFGFYDRSELRCFRQLTTISGVGPAVAIALLSELQPDKLALAVAAGDTRALTRASGVGPKLASRIVLEMKDKVTVTANGADMPTVTGNGGVAVGNAAEAVKALTVLGFSASEAAGVIGKLDETQPVDVLVRDALRALAKR